MSNAIRVPRPGVDADCPAWSVLRGPAGLHDVFRAFDRAQRSISREIVGHPGAFPGFDTLLLANGTRAADGDVVLLTASVFARSEKSHVVEYVATRVDGEGDDESAWRTSGTADVIVRGVGRTLHCEPSGPNARQSATEQSEGDAE